MTSGIIKLPYKFTPYPHQNDVFRDFFIKKKKRVFHVWHRRAGKDLTYLNMLIAAAQDRVGNYLYLFPEMKQARAAIWEGITNHGMRFLDYIPHELMGRKPRDKDMTIFFKNGSQLRFAGTDKVRFEKLRGLNPVGAVFSEYQLQNPAVMDVLRPIFANNGGWRLINGTPFGYNHFYDAFQLAKDSEDWSASLLTVRDTVKHDGSPLITEEDIQKEIEDGMNEDLVQQEFYCSFKSAVPGSVYGKEMEAAINEGRVGTYPMDRNIPVHTYWDLGHNDATSIWFVQHVSGGKIVLIDYYENRLESLKFYLKYLDEYRKKHEIRYGTHNAPFDMNTHDYGTGMTRHDLAIQWGYKFIIVPKYSIEEGIDAARTIFPMLRFDSEKCIQGIRALTNYHRSFNIKKGKYDDTPNHDWSSHCADAFRYLAVSVKKHRFEDGELPSSYNSKWDVWS